MQFLSHIWGFFPHLPFLSGVAVLWNWSYKLKVQPSIFSNILEKKFVSSQLFPQKFLWDCRSLGDEGFGFFWLFQEWVVLIWTEGGEGGNQRICNNPAAPQVYSCGHLGHFPAPF